MLIQRIPPSKTSATASITASASPLFYYIILRVQQLEKDLYYYKKTSRDLKKKLREVMLRKGDYGDIHIEESSEPLDLEPSHRHTSPTRYSPTHLPPLGNDKEDVSQTRIWQLIS